MTVRDVLAGVAGAVPTFANFLHQAVLDGEVVTTDVPAYVAVDDDQTPLQAYVNAPDPGDPLHVALAWRTALNDRGRYLDALHDLTWSPTAFRDYVWAEELLSGRSIASRVYYAVDDPAGDVAFIRFVPEVAQSSQVFESFRIRGGQYMTLKRRPNGTWSVWGLGDRMVAARRVLEG